jgi:hypothetical protein
MAGFVSIKDEHPDPGELLQDSSGFWKAASKNVIPVKTGIYNQL